MPTDVILIVAAAVVVFAIVSKRVERSAVTAPMIFAGLGLVLGPLALGISSLHIEHGFVHVLAELTLILVLFTDAARIDLRLLRKDHDLPVRLLLIGMPLTVGFGFVLATMLLGELSLGACAVLAIILAPTDAALGQAVVSSPQVPARIRQTLNVESGLNDGISLPALLFMLCLAGAAGGATSEGDGSAGFWLRFAAAQLVLGPVAGIVLAYAGAKAIQWASKRDWITPTFENIAVLALALLAFSGAELIGGNGFIAAFCAGLTIGHASRGICTCLQAFAEEEGQLLNLMVFMVFGAVMVPMLAGHIDFAMALYALLSLTVIRMAPVALALMGQRLRWETVVFVGWFGPRGLASLLFALLVVEQFELEGAETVLTVVLLTVLVSIYAHGVTANPGARWYARRAETFTGAALGPKTVASEDASGDSSGVPEHAGVSEMPVRLPHRD
ncbi:MAG: cation:proton antiporter [Gammaproteobacteria bacterium]